MKILTLLRHAKSSWEDPAARDFDRPLNKRGRRAAHAIGRALRQHGLEFDLIIASPATRVAETLRDVAETYGRELAPSEDPDLYLASPAVLLERVQRVSDAVERLLVVGHNPGLEQFAMMLSGTGEHGLIEALESKYPTGSVAEIRFEVENWADVKEGGGALVRFIRPRDLDPELGPED